ncbi:hypothetical protein E4T43_07812 [Aureobasidium subglaciale]|nr:hypothetical protein E4T43_07812 [Aureobasidium subglaciale]
MTTSGTEFLEQAFDDGYNVEQYFDGGNDEELPHGYYNNNANDEEISQLLQYHTPRRKYSAQGSLLYDQLYCLHRETTSNEFGGFIEVAHREKRMAELEAFEAEIRVMAGR